MGRSAILSNGRLTVGLDERGFVNDFYYPYVGQDNMTSARSIHHLMGIWIDGEFSWLDSDDWRTESWLDDTSMMGRSTYVNDRLGISVSVRDFVDISLDIFGRVVVVENRSDRERSVRLFFSQVFKISRSGRGDTAMFTPADHPFVLTYAGNINFVASLRNEDGHSFDQFAVGNYGIEGKVGAYMDAEDGELSGNLVEHGGVDSVIRTSFSLRPKAAYHVDYWIAASNKNYSAATDTHRAVSKNGLYHYLSATTTHWRRWLSQSDDFIRRIDEPYRQLARKSLLTIKAHCDARGGVIASADSSIYNYNRDYYNYVWPRDAAYALSSLVNLGYTQEARSYLDFAMEVMHRRGYLNHKFQPDRSMGSTWHPLMQAGVPELNIQEDETASTVLLALQVIRLLGHEDPFSHQLISRLIVPMCNFMASFIDDETGLPHASYDLWEQVFLTTTYTTGVVYRALANATELVRSHSLDIATDSWQDAVTSIEHNYGRLFDEKRQWFIRGLGPRALGYPVNDTLDISSLFAMTMYGPANPLDTTVFATAKAVEEYLVNKDRAGGVIRYPGDDYMLSSKDHPGNPWYVCTLWLSRYYLAIGEREKTKAALDWTVSHVTPSGMLSEQIDPVSGDIRGVAPLVWSHAEFLRTLHAFYQN